MDPGSTSVHVIVCESSTSLQIKKFGDPVDNATTMGTHTLNFKPAGGTGTTKGLVAGSKHILYTDGSTMFDVLDDAGHITANGTLTVAGNVSFEGGTFVFNDSQADKDFRIEGNGDAN